MANKWTVQADHDRDRQFKNGEFWYCTPSDVKKQIMFDLPFIGAAMVVAERYYVSEVRSRKAL